MIARIALAALLAAVTITAASSLPEETSTQLAPSRTAVAVVPQADKNSTSVATADMEAERRQRRLQRQKEKRERRRLKKLKRQKKRRERLLRKMQRKRKRGGDKEAMKERKKRRKNRKERKRRKKQKKREMRKKKGNLQNGERKKKKKKRDKKRKRKNGKRRNRRRRRNRIRKRRPIHPCKMDKDCEKAGPNYCCQFVTGRCVRPRGGLKCFGACMCKARKQTEDFICVTKKKKFKKFLDLKKAGKVSYEKPRGHCSNVTLAQLATPSHRYQQIP